MGRVKDNFNPTDLACGNSECDNIATSKGIGLMILVHKAKSAFDPGWIRWYSWIRFRELVVP